MGSFDIYCDFSGIGIRYSDKLIAFAIINDPNSKGYESTWDFVPIPFYGKYDDYGRIIFDESSEELADRIFKKQIVCNGDFIGKDDSILNAIYREIDNGDYLKINPIESYDSNYIADSHNLLIEKLNKTFEDNKLSYYNVTFPLGVGTNLFLLKTSHVESEDEKNLVKLALNSIGFKCDIVKTSYNEEFLVYPDFSAKTPRNNTLNVLKHEDRLNDKKLNIALYIVRKDVFDTVTKNNESIKNCSDTIKETISYYENNPTLSWLAKSNFSNLNKSKRISYDDYFYLTSIIDRTYSDCADFTQKGIFEIKPSDYPDEDIFVNVCKATQLSRITKIVMARDIQPQRSYRGTQCAHEAIDSKIEITESILNLMKSIRDEQDNDDCDLHH